MTLAHGWWRARGELAGPALLHWCHWSPGRSVDFLLVGMLRHKENENFEKFTTHTYSQFLAWGSACKRFHIPGWVDGWMIQALFCLLS